MTNRIRRILCVDDYRLGDFGIAEVYKRHFPDASFHMLKSAPEAIKFLEQCGEGSYPDVLLFDACQTGFRLDAEWGYRNSVKIIDWYTKNASALPQHVLFQSADYEYALDSARRFQEKTGIETYAIASEEYHLVQSYLREGLIPDSGVRSSGFRRFLNKILNLSIPETAEEIDQHKIKNKLWEEKDIVDFAERGLITRDQALLELHQRAMHAIQYSLDGQVIINAGLDIDDDSDEIDRETIRAQIWRARDLKFEFEEAVGSSVQGYAAFSLEDVVALAAEGKKSILFLEAYDARFVPHLKDLAAVALITNNSTGHMGVLLKSHGVTGLLGSKPLSKRFNFLRAPSGQNIEYTQRLEERDQKRLLVSYNHSLMRNAKKHSDLYYPVDGLEEGHEEPEIPVLTINVAELERDHVLLTGDPATVEVFYGSGSVYPGHHTIKEVERVGYGHWLNSVSEWLDEWHRDNGQDPLKFKSNIDHPDQIYDSSDAGIGLLRTEHFILANAEQRDALKAACLEQEVEAFQKLSGFLMSDLEDVFWRGDEKPIRIRLLDAPPSEFYDAQEQSQLIGRYGSEGARGIQLAQQLPALYQAQLDGIFGTLKKKRDDEAKISRRHSEDPPEFTKGVEILIPTVRTAAELYFALRLTRETAERYGVTHDKYRFGSMIETVDACDNIGAISEYCGFLSIGTNDLTSEVLDCARDDWAKRHQLFERDGFDPFVQLHPEVLERLRIAIRKAREVNPDIQIDLCGDHASNIESLEMLRPLRLDGASMPSIQKNMVGLKIQYHYNEFLRQQAVPPRPEPYPEAHA